MIIKFPLIPPSKGTNQKIYFSLLDLLVKNYIRYYL